MEKACKIDIKFCTVSPEWYAVGIGKSVDVTFFILFIQKTVNANVFRSVLVDGVSVSSDVDVGEDSAEMRFVRLRSKIGQMNVF